MFLSDLTKKEDGILKLSDVLVAMIAVCGRLNMILTKSISSLVELVPVILQELTVEPPAILNQGLSKILCWRFVLLCKRDRRKLIAEF